MSTNQIEVEQRGPSAFPTPALVIILLALFIAVPYTLAVAQGEAEAGLAGVSRLTSAARQVYCKDGINPFTTTLMAEIGILALATAVAFIAGRRTRWINTFLRSEGPRLIVLFVLISIPFLIAWQTGTSACSRGRAFFWQSVFIEVFILAALAISYNLMFGFSGVISFGHAAFFGIGAYSVGLLILHLELPLLAAIGLTLGVSILMGLFVSVIGVRIRGLYFAIFTLAFAEIFFILSQNRILTDITGAEDGFTFAVPDWINATRNRLTFFYLALAFLVFSFLLVRQVVNSPTGRIMNALRENEDRALMLGFNTFIYKTLSIVLAGGLATGAGILRGLLNKGASPNVLGIGFTIDPLLMTLIGGTGSFSGPVIGAFFLRLTEQLLRDTVVTIAGTEVNIGERWALILGVLFILSVMVFPSGIVGSVRSWWANWKRRSVT